MADDPGNPDSYSIRKSFFGVRIVYKELCDGRWQKLVVPAEDWGRNKLMYNRLAESEWQRLTPEWAWKSKDLIEYRIVTDTICDHD